MAQKKALSQEQAAESSFWAVIPHTVLAATDIKPNAKLLYAAIVSLQASRGYCFASNRYLAQKLGIAQNTVPKLLRELTDAGYLRLEVTTGESNGIHERRIFLAENLSKTGVPIAQTDIPIAQTCNTPMYKRAMGGCTNMQPENININNNQKHTPSKSPKGDGWEREFDQFWQSYPKKKSKHDAKRAFAKIVGKAELSTLLSALDRQKQSPQWTKDNGQYIPYPATWLNGHRWEDEPEETAPAPAFVPREEHIPVPY